MGTLYRIYWCIVFVYQLSVAVPLPVTIQQKQLYFQPRDVSPSNHLPKVAPPQNVLMSLSIEPGTGPSSIPCLATIRVSSLPVETANPVFTLLPEPGIVVSFGDVSDLVPPCQLNPKASRSSVMKPPFPFVDDSPTITSALSVIPFTEVGGALIDETIPPLIEKPYVTTYSRNIQQKVPAGRKVISQPPVVEDIDHDNLLPNLEMQRSLQSSINSSSKKLDITSKFANSQSRDNINNQAGYTVFDPVSPLNKQVFQLPKYTNLNEYLDSKATPIGSEITTLTNMPLTKTLDKDQFSINVHKNVFPIPLSTVQEPSSITTLPITTKFYSSSINYPLKARTSSLPVSTSNEILPTVNISPANYLLPNLTLSLPSQSKEHLTTEGISPTISQNTLLSQSWTPGSAPMVQATQANLGSIQKVNNILKSAGYENYKSSKPTSLDDIGDPISLKSQNLKDTCEKSLSVGSNFIDNDRLLSSTMPTQDEFSMFKSKSLENKAPDLAYNATNFARNSLNCRQTNNLIKQANPIINRDDSVKSPNSLLSYTNGSDTNLGSNKNQNNLLRHSEMSLNIGTKNINQQSKLINDKSFSEYSCYKLNVVPQLISKKSEPAICNPSSVPIIGLPYKDRLSNTNSKAYSDDLTNSMFPSFHSEKRFSADIIEPNSKSVQSLKISEFAVEKTLSGLLPNLPFKSLEPFNLSTPLITSPSYLPKPELTNHFTTPPSTSTSVLVPSSEESLSVDISNSLSTLTPCIKSIIINIIPYTQGTASEIIIII